MPSLRYLHAEDIFGTSIEINVEDERIYYNGLELEDYTLQFRAGNLAIKDPRSADKIMHIKCDDLYTYIKIFNPCLDGIKSRVNEKLLSIKDTRDRYLRNNLAGYVSPDEKFFYIRIHKNASTKLVNFFKRNNWSYVDVLAVDADYYYNKCKLFCILREPYSRYISGFAQFLTTHSLDDIGLNIQMWQSLLLKAVDKSSKFDILKMFFAEYDKFDFDNHTKLQAKILGRQDCSKINFFFLDDLLGSNLTSFFQSNGSELVVDNTIENQNRNHNNIYSLVYNFFEDSNNLPYKENLLQYLKPDYHFINSIQFYAG